MTRKFTDDHEWLDVAGDTATVGITDYAQGQLGDVVFVELPEIGRKVKKGDSIAVVESVKAASDVYAPVSGEIVGRNEEIVNEPGLVNTDADGKAWFFKIKLSDAGELAACLDEAAYSKLIG